MAPTLTAVDADKLVEWVGSEERWVYQGQPGLVVDDGGPTNISVQLVGGPSLVANHTDLRPLDRTAFVSRTARLREGWHPTSERRVETLSMLDWP